MRHACTLICAAALAGCAPAEPIEEASSPIEGGRLDHRDRGVVGVLLADDTGYPRRACTGALIAPDLVLTAQHCVATTRPSVDCATSIFQAPSDPGLLRITASPSMWSEGARWSAVRSISTPPGGDAVCGRDLALLELVDPLPDPPLFLRLDDHVIAGERYAAVGYGAIGDHRGESGLRRRRDRLQVRCVGRACGTRQVEDREWRGDHGICPGDSGSPAFDEEGQVIGISSRGPAGCEAPIYGAVAPHADWIQRVARASAEAHGEPPPAWSEVDPPALTASGGGCAASPARPASRSPALALLVLAAFRRRRAAASFRPAPR